MRNVHIPATIRAENISDGFIFLHLSKPGGKGHGRACVVRLLRVCCAYVVPVLCCACVVRVVCVCCILHELRFGVFSPNANFPKENILFFFSFLPRSVTKGIKVLYCS